MVLLRNPPDTWFVFTPLEIARLAVAFLPQQEDAKARKKVEQLMQKTRALDEIRQREKKRQEFRHQVCLYHKKAYAYNIRFNLRFSKVSVNISARFSSLSFGSCLVSNKPKESGKFWRSNKRMRRNVNVTEGQEMKLGDGKRKPKGTSEGQVSTRLTFLQGTTVCATRLANPS